MSRGRAYATDRELLLTAYEKVTPPRTEEETLERERLLGQARRILTGAPKPPRQLALGAGSWR